MLVEMAGSRSCEGRAFQDNAPNEQNAHGVILQIYLTLMLWLGVKKSIQSAKNSHSSENKDRSLGSNLINNENEKLSTKIKAESVCVWLTLEGCCFYKNNDVMLTH